VISVYLNIFGARL